MLKYLAPAVLLLLSGCTITKSPEVVATNPLTGTVRLGYTLAPLQKGKVDSYAANSTATRQCQQWGFATALPYGNPITTCSVITGTQCMAKSVVLEYQCRGIAINSTTAVSHWY